MTTQSDDRRDGILNICLSLLLSVICGLVLYEASRMPKSDFEPLGPAFLPAFLSFGILVLAIVVFVRGIKLFIKTSKQIEDPTPILTPLAIYAIILTVLYVAVMYFTIANFRIATIFYITILGYMLTHFDFKGLIISFILSILTAFCIYYIFTKILVISIS